MHGSRLAKITTVGLLVGLCAGSVIVPSVANASVVPTSSAAIAVVRPPLNLFAEGAVRAQSAASRIAATTSLSQRLQIAQQAYRDLDLLRPYFTGSAAVRFSSDLDSLYSYSRKGYWETTKAILNSISRKLNAVVAEYQRGGDGMAKYF